MERSFSSPNKGFLRRDLVEAAPREQYVSTYNPENDQIILEAHLAKKELLAWRRRSVDLLDKDGNEHKICVGYSHPDQPKVIVVANQRSFNGYPVPLDGVFFAKYGSRVAPFVRVSFSEGDNRALDIYSSDPDQNPFLETRQNEDARVFATPDDLYAQVQVMAERKGYSFINGAQFAWDNYIADQFSRLRFEGDIARKNGRSSWFSGRRFWPKWTFAVSLGRLEMGTKRTGYFSHRELGLPSELDKKFSPFSCVLKHDFSYQDLCDKNPGDVIQRFNLVGDAYHDEGLYMSDKEREQNRRRLFDARTHRMSNALQRIPKQEVPFTSVVGGGLTNGEIRIPKDRPHGQAAWSGYDEIRRLQSIDKSNWSRMLEVTEGTYHRDLDRLEERVRESKQRDHQKARETAITKKVIGECLDMKLLDEVSRVDISFGERLLIEGIANGRRIYIVDSPKYGVGLYVFLNRVDASAWAGGDIGFEEARRRATRFIVHDEGWKERVKRVIDGIE